MCSAGARVGVVHHRQVWQVQGRPSDMVNTRMLTGSIEVEAHAVELLNDVSDLPIRVHHIVRCCCAPPISCVTRVVPPQSCP